MKPNNNEGIEREIEAQEDYKRFSEFWENARNITDEDGDNFLTWDKSNMCHLSFSRGFKQGSQSKEKEMLDKFEKIIDEIDDSEIISHYGKTQDERIAINLYVKEWKKVIKQKLKGDEK